MDDFARQSQSHRKTVFEEAGIRLGLHPTSVEKDFWVCWTLRRLFELPVLQGRLVFKGGTTLSKVYGIIRRFSEDIDLTLDRTVFDYGGDRDPDSANSRKQRERLLADMATACANFVQSNICQALAAACDAALGKGIRQWRVANDGRDPDRQTLLFVYPPAVNVDSATSYVEPSVRLEFGSRGEPWPTTVASIQPYASEQFPDVFTYPAVAVTALSVERTFWEKATILHQEAHRPQAKPMPGRSSRHYYDLAMLAKSPVRENALQQLPLLETVVQHKKHFFRCGWAGYDTAQPGTLRLLPPDDRLKALSADFEQMQVMMFGDCPSFDEIMVVLGDLQREIHALQ
ncbi:MAG: nucleotidyl transferase AbiEii/AbiGii toxin family protein [Lentisphaerae bacterium]|jgi:hypothetical protein|nr:nucleotidyl transferase AbiEii/AbiGii toxin family protein [Lentisphaerota bacterium]MBT4816725.1 nucleotidyl transferase AbiEii/AbiGii toxin family protein [Lentisphaerota bacterium]MBT7060232.1 nucleotidyl transferase AbiEii/AbiGii toxin family protein [Lentisphaerota bacterium]MBT7847452.1 nucleotidyl transferase AbiEii/AbiGii toxin family protein [Lentisphaerota bacterium]